MRPFISEYAGKQVTLHLANHEVITITVADVWRDAVGTVLQVDDTEGRSFPWGSVMYFSAPE